MHLESDAMTEAMAEQLAEPAPLNVVPRDRIGIPPGHARADRRARPLVRDPHHIVNLPLLRRRMPHDEGPGYIGAVAADDGPEVHEQEVARLDDARRRSRVWKRRALAQATTMDG